ncbi:MerR family transcriptional regulator [Oerskovia flava]|uniref:helix-turn-helix domain-containing protein n=1 Tax=Oerskovia flava TaxID=2986422 RepID=UPI00223F3BD7|nr:MerR family transcriptional regulator [Oerskovia sp. JB1-3-2]
MRQGMLGVGALAEASGLTPSALRFYDAKGVLRPDHVDDAGRRWYTADRVAAARVVAALRQARAPLDVIRAAVEPGGAGASVVVEYVRELERHALALQRAVEPAAPTEGRGTTASLSAADLRDGLTAVTATMGRDPLHPSTHGMRVAVDGAGVILETTDRHRLMRRRLRAHVSGARAVAIDGQQALGAIAAMSGEVRLTIGAHALTLTDSSHSRTLAASEFPAATEGLRPDRSLPASAPVQVGELLDGISKHKGADRIWLDAPPGAFPTIGRTGPGRVFSARLLSEALWTLPRGTTCVLLGSGHGPLWVLPLSRSAELAVMPIRLDDE